MISSTVMGNKPIVIRRILFQALFLKYGLILGYHAKRHHLFIDVALGKMMKSRLYSLMPIFNPISDRFGGCQQNQNCTITKQPSPYPYLLIPESEILDS